MKPKIQLPFQHSHAFIIAINDYQHVSPLSTAVNDANTLAKQLAELHDYRVHGPLLNATKADLIRLLEEEMPRLVGADDRVLFYFAGHGIALDSDDNPKGYLVPADAKPGETESLVSMDLLHQAFTSLPCQHGILLMDCCFAGSFKWSTGFRDVVFDLPAIIYEERFYQYARDPAWQVITSSASDQKAVDILANRTLGMRNESGAEHSPFALALLDGLAGEADTVPKDREDGVITATELYTYLRDRVEDETTEQSVRQSPSMFSLSRHEKGQYIFLNPRHPLNLPPIPRRNPFMGLKSYNEDDQLLFYGRDRVIAALEKLGETSPLIVVSGASGTGKSSVVKAGLLPLLRKKGWQILPVVRPGKEPIKSLDTAIPDLADQLNGPTPTLLIIDQYEELITQCLNPDERIAFEEQLDSWMDAYPQLRVVISVRSDFEPQFEGATLAMRWDAGRYVVPAFSQDELREVIIKPTIQEVLFFEPDALVDKLVDAVNQAPGALPLLSFTLSELYHAYLNSGRTNRAFTLEDYEKLGGVIGALRTRANAIYDELDEAHQDSMRKLMIRMVSLEGGELASRRVGSDDLTFTQAAETQRIRRVAQQLVEARLVSSGRDMQGRTYYEPAHDALVRAWARLWEWIKATGEENLSLRSKLSLAVSDYRLIEEEGKAKQYLWHEDPRLDLLNAQLKANDHSFNIHEEQFIRKSIARRDRLRRRNWIIAIAVIIGLVGLTIYSRIQANAANKQTQIAKQETERAEKAEKAALDSAAVAQEQREYANIKAMEARDSAAVARLERENALNQKKATERQAELGEARRLAFLSTQETGRLNYVNALRLAYRAHQLAGSTTLPSIQKAFADILYNRGYFVLLDTSFQYSSKILGAKFSENQEAILLWEEGNRYTQQPLTVGAKRESLKSRVTNIFSSNQFVGKKEADSANNSPGDTIFFPGDKRQKLVFLSRTKAEIIWWDTWQPTYSERWFAGGTFKPRFGERWSGKKELRDTITIMDNVYTIQTKTDGEIEQDGKHPPASFSKDGQFFQIAAKDKIEIWPIFGDKLATINYSSPVLFAELSPKAKLILTRGEKPYNRLQLRSVKGQLIFEFPEQVKSGSFSPDGDRILTCDSTNLIQVWKIVATNLLEAIDNRHLERGSQIIWAQMVEDRTILGVARMQRAPAFLLIDQFGKILDEVDGSDMSEFHLTPSKGFLKAKISDSASDRYWLYHIATGRDYNDIQFPNKYDPYNELFLATSPSENFMIVIDEDGYVAFKDLAEEQYLKIDFSNQSALSDHSARLAASFSLDGTRVLLSKENEKVSFLYDHKGSYLGASDFAGYSPQFAPNTNFIIAPVGQDSVKLWNKNGQILSAIPHRGKLNEIRFSPKRDLLFTIHNMDSVGLWQIDGRLQGYFIHDFRYHNAVPLFSPNGDYCLPELGEGWVQIRTLSGRLVKNTKEMFMCFWPEHDYFLTADGTVWGFDGKEKKSIKAEYGYGPEFLQFSPDNQYFLAMKATNGAQLMDLDGNLLAVIPNAEKVIFAPIGKYILARENNKVQLLDGFGGSLAEIEYTTATENGSSLADLAFSPDGKLILLKGEDPHSQLKLLATPLWLVEWIEKNPLPKFTEEEKLVFGIR